MSKRKHGHSEAFDADLEPDESAIDEAKPKTAAEPVTHTGVLYSCVDGKLTLMKDESLQTPGPCYDLAEGGECTINGKKYPLDDLKRGDKVTLEGEPVTKIVATR